jgi:hypothetical protein
MSDDSTQEQSNARPTRPTVPTSNTTRPSGAEGSPPSTAGTPLKRPGSAMRSSVTGTVGRGGSGPPKRAPSPSSGRPSSGSASETQSENAKNLANVKNLWTIIQEQKKNQPPQEKPKTDVMEANVLLLGAEKSGKTIITYKTLKKDYIKEDAPTTVALEYTYGKREESFKTLVAHFWEIG